MKCKKCWIAAAILCATMACVGLAGCSFGGDAPADTSSTAVVSQADTNNTGSVTSEITMNGQEGTASQPAELVGTYYWTRLSDDGKSFHTIEELLVIMQSDPNNPNYIPADQVDTVRKQMESSCVELKADGTGSISDGKGKVTALLWSVSEDTIIFSNPAAPSAETDIYGKLDREKHTITIDSTGEGTVFFEYTK